MSAAYTPPPLVTCPACGLTRVGRRRAVLLAWRSSSIARLWCRGCGHRWRVPVRPT
ncbi:MAG: hypothetical protein M9894_17185 [Planctomycetes bacterium]|nr:hypothetical protein [Planctomycetota bacterium]